MPECVAVSLDRRGRVDDALGLATETKHPRSCLVNLISGRAKRR